MGKTFEVPVGVSVAKTNSPETVDVVRGIDDYEKAFRLAITQASYVTVNISCPNAFGGEPFSTPERLERLLARLDLVETAAPVFLKIAADQSETELDAFLNVVDRHRVHGLIFSNLTKQRVAERMDLSEFSSQMRGGVSGRPCVSLSNRLVSHAYRRAPGRYVLVGCGGVFSAEDAYEKIRLGANLVQLITGMIFQGPQLIGEINRGLASFLHRDGFSHISEAVGAAHRV
jgi:dihydroorotate dehydrogenase